MKNYGLIALFLCVAACSGSGDEIIFDKVLGPETKLQVKTLPKDLRGDASGENLSGEELKNKDAVKDGEQSK